MSEKIILKVEGMGCQGCVAAVEKAARSVSPEAKVEVDLAGGLVSIDAAVAGRDAFAAAIAKAGYDIVG